MASKIQIWSMASIELGNGPQTSESANNTFIKAMSEIYDTTLESWLVWQRWGFARKKAELSRNATDPLNEYSASYQIPADALAIFKLYPHVANYRIYGDDIYCNLEGLEIDYLYRPQEGDFPSYFVDALVVQLASRLAYSVTNNASLADSLKGQSVGMWQKAAAADAQQRSTEDVVDKPLVWNRFVG